MDPTATALTSRQFVALICSFFSKATMRRYNASPDFSSYRLEQVLGDVQRFARYGEIPREFGLTAYGIAWSVDSGRINGATHIALKAMKCRQLLDLVHRVHMACSNIGEIPAYLMSLDLEPV
jgi:hypothetical protein